jgi:uncharacterized protein YbjT (DUF2867 family)
MDSPSAAHYEGETQFRKAWGLIARRGRVLISDGRLTLLTRAGQQVVSAPLREVTVRRPWWTLGNGCYAAFANVTYYLTLRSLGETVASTAIGGAIAQAVFGREATEIFVDALERARRGLA